MLDQTVLLLRTAQAQMIADKMQKWVVADKIARAGNCVAVAARFMLRNEMQPIGVRAGRFGIRGFGAGLYDDGDVSRTSALRFLDQNLQSGFCRAILINDGLKRQTALAGAGCRDDGFADVHSDGDDCTHRHFL